MAGSLTDAGEKAVLNYIFRGTAFLDATNLWIALFTTTPTDSSTGTEVSTSGTAYARAAIVRTGGGWDAASGTSPATTANTTAIAFSTATADWGTVTGFGICTSLAGALATDLLYWGSLDTAQVVNNGLTFSFPAGDIDVTQD